VGGQYDEGKEAATVDGLKKSMPPSAHS